ncbi:MAG: M28 family peptidase [Chloroflexota bacterium]
MDRQRHVLTANHIVILSCVFVLLIPWVVISFPKKTPRNLLPLSEIPSNNKQFEGNQAFQHITSQLNLGPRPTGSSAGWATGEFIIAELEAAGWQVEIQEFYFKGVKGRNIIGKRGQGTQITMLGAHYDTRPAADWDPDPTKHAIWIDGANDGASGVAVLLELARTVDTASMENDLWLLFFDAEDRGQLDGWPFLVGSNHFVQTLTVTPQELILVDMVGDKDQTIFFERSSDMALQQEIWAVAADLGYKDTFIPQVRHTIVDDHTPFIERQIPAIDIIDFDYPYWHTTADTIDKVSPESLHRVGHTLEVWLERTR